MVVSDGKIEIKLRRDAARHLSNIALPSMRHNRVRDITAQLLTKVCPKVGTEPALQPLSGESFPLRSTNVEEGARLDMKAQNFWVNSK